MRQLQGNKDLQLAKDILKAFEEQHHPNSTACSDIQEGLFWDEDTQCYSADLGFLLRGETDKIKIFEAEDEWIDIPHSRPVAFINFNRKLYFLALRF